jgi:hypothetical protein
LLGAWLGAGAESSPYPVTGYWLFGRPNEAAWQSVLDRICNLGADTVIQFGARPARKTLDQIRTHPLFSKCPGLEAMTNPPPHRIYTFETQEDFGSSLLVDPALERRVEIGEQIVWRLIVPATAQARGFKPRPPPPAYDLLLVSGRKSDSVSNLLQVAAAHHCRVFVGLPCAMADPRCPWDPDNESLPLLEDLTRRILKDYAERFGHMSSFAGVYQSLETPVSRACLTKVLAVYRLQHGLVRAALPGKQILISPYWDARKTKPTGTAVAAVKAGIRLLAHQNVDIIAPQDSRGTGKVGLFWPHQMAEAVDIRLEPAVGQLTYGAAYHTNTTGFYRAAREALDELARQEGLHIDLWANLEAFEPVQPANAVTDIQRTTQERLEQAVMFAGIHPTKLISFMWDDFYTSKAGRPLSLGEELESSARRPIIVDVQVGRQAGSEGLLVRGYDLAEASAEISWTDLTGEKRSVNAPLVAVPTQVHATVTHPLPARLQTAWLALNLSELPAGARVSLTLARQGRHCFHSYIFHLD